MFLSDISLKRPIAMTVVLLVLALFGFLAWRTAGVDLVPLVDVPYVTVTVVYPGATPEEIETAAGMVQEAAHPDAHIIFGASIDETMDDEMRVVVVATGFDEDPKSAQGAEKKPAVPTQASAGIQGTDAATLQDSVEDAYKDLLSIFNRK